MIINHNISALNTYRQLSSNNVMQNKSLEKLSSGLRINRAGDDAAGLAISEKMRAQIRGLNQATRNSQDAISLIQTAEGALQETHAILQRMRELAIQASNDTYVDQDRSEIQKEINQLTSEINRIGNTTEFNTMKVLNGDRAAGGSVTVSKDVLTDMATTTLSFADAIDFSGVNGKAPAFEGDIITIDAAAEGISDLASGKTGTIIIKKIAGDQLEVRILVDAAHVSSGGVGVNVVDTIKVNDDGDFVYDAHGVSFTIKGTEYQGMNVGDQVKVTVDSSHAGTDVSTTNDFIANVVSGSGTLADVTVKVAPEDGWEDVRSAEVTWDSSSEALKVVLKDADGKVLADDTFDGIAASSNFTYDNHGITIDLTTNDATEVAFNYTFDTKSVTETQTVEDKSINFQVGANENQAMMLDINDMRSVALGISSKTGGEGWALSKDVTDGTDNTGVEFALSVATHKDAAASVTVINNAINTVSAERSKLGAVQNRLEHTINNLGASAENLTAAESRIRDVDMAQEMMEFTKTNILSQAATAMLAQANQQPQMVLQLLR